MSPSASAAVRMPSAPPIVRSPLYFGDPGRPLFGWYHAPHAGALDTAVVICPSVGHEYVNAHRSLRHLADQLATRGIPALRFDYLGTGDSASGGDPDRIDAWLDSIRAALDVARETSGRDRLGLIGLRLGATMAAAVARDLTVEQLVLWAPCSRGRSFLRELRALELAARPGRATTTSPRDIEAGGFRATPDLQRDIGGLDLEQLVPRARRVLIADRSDFPDAETFATRWTQNGVAVDRQIAPGFAEMILPPHNAVVPSAAIAGIADWVAAGASLAPPRPRLVARRSSEDRRVTIGDIHEHVCRFGAGGAIFGIVSAPSRPPAANVPAIVLPNAGSSHHVGPNGLYVRLARSLARAGFRVLRFDLPGLGDSLVDDPSLENVPYPSNASAIIGAAMEAIASRSGDATFVLMGLCSGAHASFHAAVDLASPAVVEAVLINPLTFAYRPGMSLDAPSAPHVGRWKRYRQSMTSLRGWAKLLRPEVSFGRLARDVVEHAALVIGTRRASRQPSALEASLARLSNRGRRLTLVCSRYDPGYDLLMLGAGPAVRSLKRAGVLDAWFIDDANHTFDQSRGRATLVASITKALSQRYLKH